jgi:hypothetical protein
MLHCVFLYFTDSSSYTGCFIDFGSERVLPEYQGRINIMTNEMCKEICKNQGYKFSGTEVSIKTYSQDNQVTLKMYPLRAVVLYIELELYELFQGRIQDFKLGGGGRT